MCMICQYTQQDEKEKSNATHHRKSKIESELFSSLMHLSKKSLISQLTISGEKKTTDVEKFVK